VLLCLTANHRNASFDLLEKLSIGAPSAVTTLVEGSAFVSGAVVLATCNRFEAYLDIDEPLTSATAVAVQSTIDIMSEASGVLSDDLRASVTVISGDAVAGHLFAVTSGLESVVVGEDEISGQVGRALGAARASGTTSPVLDRLFQTAAHTSRDVKNRTALGGAGRSLVRLALDLADSRIADWSKLRVLLIGTGSYAAVTLAALRDHGAEDISVHSPSGRATPFAAKHGIRAVAPERFPSAVTHADLIITCTSAEHHVLSAATFAAGRGAYDTAIEGQPAASACPIATPDRRLVIDLGLPRNVDPDVAGVSGVDLLDLETIRIHAPLDELQATDAARQVVRDAARRFATVGERKSITPAVVALRTHIFGLMESEISRARARGDDDGRTEQALRHLVGVLLHTPTSRAHQLAEDGRTDDYITALSTLYGLEVAEPEAPVADAEPGVA